MPTSPALIAMSACTASVLAVEVALRIHLAVPLLKLKTASASSLSTMTDKTLSDEEKSARSLALSRDILVSSVDLLVRIAAVLGAFLAVFLGAGAVIGSGLSPYWDALGMLWLQGVVVVAAMLFLWGRMSVSRRL